MVVFVSARTPPSSPGASWAEELDDLLSVAGVEHERRGDDVRLGGHLWSPINLAHPTVPEVTPHARSGVLVLADRLSAEVRKRLAEGGAAWVDRRGELEVPGSPPITASFDARVLPPERVIDVFTPSGLDLAVVLLDHPGRAWGVQELARHTDRSPGRVSELLRALRDQGLVDVSGKALVPELFWAVADAWRPRWRRLGERALAPSRRSGAGVVVGGTRAAVAWGAPLVATGDSPWQLYVSGRWSLGHVLRGADGLLGGLVSPPGPVYAAVCPSPRAGIVVPPDRPVLPVGLPVASLAVAALDLAGDRGRGREILEGWTPEGGGRVW
jgi:DNA-binding transcriptional ArsR family regulator